MDLWLIKTVDWKQRCCRLPRPHLQETRERDGPLRARGGGSIKSACRHGGGVIARSNTAAARG